MLRGRLEWSVGSAAVGHRIVMTPPATWQPFDPVRALEMAMVGTTLATYGGGSGDAGIDATTFLPPLPDDSSPRLLCLAALLAGEQHVLANRMTEAADEFRTAFELVQSIGDDSNLLSNTALAAFHLGDWQVTLRDFTRVLDIARAAGDVSRIVFALSRLPMGDVPAGRWAMAAQRRTRR